MNEHTLIEDDVVKEVRNGDSGDGLSGAVGRSRERGEGRRGVVSSLTLPIQFER